MKKRAQKRFNREQVADAFISSCLMEKRVNYVLAMNNSDLEKIIGAMFSKEKFNLKYPEETYKRSLVSFIDECYYHGHIFSIGKGNISSGDFSDRGSDYYLIDVEEITNKFYDTSVSEYNIFYVNRKAA